MRAIIAAGILGLACSAQAQTLYKCGSSYQQTPCADGKSATVNISGAGKADLNSAASISAQKDVLKYKRDKAIERAIEQRQVAVGMTTDEVRKSWGDPTRINKMAGPYGVHEQWVYERGGMKSQYVNVENGSVKSVQSME